MIFLIGLGGSLGAICRYVLTKTLTKNLGESFPFATLSINLLASFLLGYVLAHALNSFLYISEGFLGALSTFSTFIFEGTMLLEGHKKKGYLYLIVSLPLGILFFTFGFLL